MNSSSFKNDSSLYLKTCDEASDQVLHPYHFCVQGINNKKVTFTESKEKSDQDRPFSEMPTFSYGKSILTLWIIICILLYSFFIRQIRGSEFRHNFFRFSSRKQNDLQSDYGVRFLGKWIVFICNISFYAITIALYMAERESLSLGKTIDLLYKSFSIIGLFFFIKYLFYKIVESSLLSQKGILSSPFLNLYGKSSFFLIIPLIFSVVFANNLLIFNTFIFINFSILIITNIIYFYIEFLSFEKVKIGFFYFFIYLCAFEILPYLFLIQYFKTY